MKIAYRIDDRFLVEDDPGGPRFPIDFEIIQPVYSPSVGVDTPTPKPVTLVKVQPASPTVFGVYGAMPISSSPSTNVLSTPTVDLTPAQQAALTQAQVLSEQLDDEAKKQGIPMWVYLVGGAAVVYLLTQ